MCEGNCSCQLKRISQLEEELAAAKQKILDLVDYFIVLIGSNFCERHQEVMQTISLADFHAIISSKCELCVREELAELTTEGPRDAEEDETPPLL